LLGSGLPEGFELIYPPIDPTTAILSPRLTIPEILRKLVYQPTIDLPVLANDWMAMASSPPAGGLEN